MTEQTIGEREDERAFRDLMDEVQGFFAEARKDPELIETKEGRRLKSHATMAPLYMEILRLVLRHFFDAGMKRGEEKRGCCEKREEVTK